MSTTTDLSTLKINYLTQSQYNTALSGGQINENEIYLTPTEDMTTQEVQDFVGDLNINSGSSTISAICPLASGWANYSDAFYPTVYRTGNVCTFVWSAKPTAASVVIDGNYKQICTIPEGFRPPQELHGIFQGSSTSIYLLTINQSGDVYISRMREISNNAGSYSTAGSNNGYLWFPMFMTYVVL